MSARQNQKRIESPVSQTRLNCTNLLHFYCEFRSERAHTYDVRASAISRWTLHRKPPETEGRAQRTSIATDRARVLTALRSSRRKKSFFFASPFRGNALTRVNSLASSRQLFYLIDDYNSRARSRYSRMGVKLCLGFSLRSFSVKRGSVVFKYRIFERAHLKDMSLRIVNKEA